MINCIRNYLCINFFFKFRTPIITTVPSEDHTYSAGGGSKRSSSVNQTPIHANDINGNDDTHTENGVNAVSPTNLINNNSINHLNNSDNASNGTSSDAAYESSEER